MGQGFVYRVALAHFHLQQVIDEIYGCKGQEKQKLNLGIK